MSDKILITTVESANDLFDEAPSAFALRLNDDLKARIRKLAAIAREHDVYSLQAFCYQGIWSESAEALDAPTPLEAMQLAQSQEVRVDTPMLEVATSEFRFTAVPRHADESLQITTPWIPLEALSMPKTHHCTEQS